MKTVMAPGSPGAFALLYAERGWPVLPIHPIEDGACACRRRGCGSPGKHPRTMNGSKAATTDPEQIWTWWTWWPDSNVAIATGSGLQVLDVEHDGFDALEELIDGRPWPRVPTVYTGGGGLHFYFAGDGRNSTKELGDSIDVRGAGGFVVAPPSLHASGERYSWLVLDAALEPWPDWLVPPRNEPLGTTESRPDNAPRVGARADRYVRVAFERELEAVRTASEGTRNDQLNRSAFALGRFVQASELGMREVAEALVTSAIVAGLDEDEARRTVASGLKARA